MTLNEHGCFEQDRTIWHGKAIVRENVQEAQDTFRLAVSVDHGTQGVFPTVQSGQFAMFRLADHADPLLGRPLAVYRTTAREHSTLVEAVYLVVGKMTSRLSQVRPGDTLELWAPLGRPFRVRPEEHTIMVAGGIGQTPFLMLAARLRNRTLLYGAKTVGRIACLDDFRQLGVDVQVATDDGSLGYQGPVTDLIEKNHTPDQPTKILCCGPHPMLKAAFQIAKKLQIPCEVSLETPMSCGLGICYGCVVPYLSDPSDKSSFDYKRTCVDGPAFDAYRLLWD